MDDEVDLYGDIGDEVIGEGKSTVEVRRFLQHNTWCLLLTIYPSHV